MAGDDFCIVLYSFVQFLYSCRTGATFIRFEKAREREEATQKKFTSVHPKALSQLSQNLIRVERNRAIDSLNGERHCAFCTAHVRQCTLHVDLYSIRLGHVAFCKQQRPLTSAGSKFSVHSMIAMVC